MGDCPVHGPLLKVRDKVIPTRARLTLPHYLMLKELELRTANQQGKFIIHVHLQCIYIDTERRLVKGYEFCDQIMCTVTLTRYYGAFSTHSQEHQGEPLLFLISALGSFTLCTCVTQHMGLMALHPIRRKKQWLCFK